MIMTVEGDTDVRMMFKENDEQGYVYVCIKDSVAPRVSKNVSATMGGQGPVRMVHEVELVADGARVLLKKRWK